MRIRFTGHSDDIVRWDAIGTKQRDEVDCFQSGSDLHHCTLLVSSVGGAQAVKVHAIYDGCWSFSAGLVEEGRSLPPWGFEIADRHEYSTQLIIDTHGEPVTVAKVTP